MQKVVRIPISVVVGAIAVAVLTVTVWAHTRYCYMKMKEHLESAQLFESEKYGSRSYGSFEPDPRIRPARLAEYDRIAKSETELATAYGKAVWQPWLHLSIVEPPPPSFNEVEHKIKLELMDAATLPNSAAPAERVIIHVCDWHHVSRESFAAELRSRGTNIDDDEIGPLYAEHLNEVEAVQAEQLELLRILVKKHHLKHVWVEGLTPDDMPGFRAIVDVLRQSQMPDRELFLQIGAPGRLVVSGELFDVMPLDDEKTHAAARPLNGGIDPSSESSAAREKSISARLLGTNEPVSVIVLGAGHDLSGYFVDQAVTYKRITPKKVEYLMAIP